MLTKVTPGKTLGLERGSVVVCVPAGQREQTALASEQEVVATLRTVMEHTDPATPLLIAGSAMHIDQIVEELHLESSERIIHTLSLALAANEIEVVNAAISATFPSDLALVIGGIAVAANWLTRLRAAAISDSIVASATPLSLGVGGVEILKSGETPPRLGGQQATSSTTELIGRVSSRSLHLRPRIASIGPGCAYMRRQALELTGPLNHSRSLESALFDLAADSIATGMVHVAADDVLVCGRFGKRACPASQEAAGSQGSDDKSQASGDDVRNVMLNDERGRLCRALGIASTSLRRISVTIDGRALTSTVGGTQTYILELVAALAVDGEVAVRVLIPQDLSERAIRAFEGLSDVELLSYEQALKKPPLTDVVHRPQQVFTPDDMALLRLVGRRIVIGQQDLIAYHSYSYHRDVDHWCAYRRTTRLALAAADQAVFFSEHARRDALAEDLLSATRTHVVGIGADVSEPTGPNEAQPEGVSGDSPFLLCIGADYAHKNRLFAIVLLEALIELGWTGRLVLAGSHVDFGSSREHERVLLRSRPELADLVLDIGPVDEAEKSWLYRRARALLYPTIYEGFGLLPLEAARAGLPCLFASQASLTETGGEAATLVPWDPHASAAVVLPLLADGEPHDRHLAQLRALPMPTWSEVARQLVAVYEQAIAQPASEAAPRVWQELERENYIVRLDQDARKLKATAQEYQDAYHSLSARVTSGLPLIDEGGLLSHAQQRGLMRVAGRKRLGAMFLAPFGLLGRLMSSEAADFRDDHMP